ncbi:MAG: hypothetical protein WC654_00980 [Patescibacteria group bacterium]
MPRVKKRSILLIEQDANFAGIYEKRFEVAGWKVTRAKSFQEGKKKLARMAHDAVMMDLHPLTESMAFLEELGKDPTMTSIVRVVLTDVSDRRTIKEVEGLGVAVYLLKGHVSPSEVIRKVKSYLI